MFKKNLAPMFYTGIANRLHIKRCDSCFIIFALFLDILFVLSQVVWASVPQIAPNVTLSHRILTPFSFLWMQHSSTSEAKMQLGKKNSSIFRTYHLNDSGLPLLLFTSLSRAHYVQSSRFLGGKFWKDFISEYVSFLGCKKWQQKWWIYKNILQ